MKIYHVFVQQAEEGWLAAHALEDESVHTQGRSLDEIIRNIREVVDLLHGESKVQVELVVPAALKMRGSRSPRAPRAPRSPRGKQAGSTGSSSKLRPKRRVTRRAA